MRRRSEQGYILLTLLLVVTLMTIAAAIIVSDLKFEMKRDREEEMVHRGVQYSRAIRAYYKKFGRYPAKNGWYPLGHLVHHPERLCV